MSRSTAEVLRDVIVTTGIQEVFIGDAPALERECVALRLSDGYESTYYFGKSSIREPLVEIVIRTNLYEKGQQWYTAIRRVLDQYSNQSEGIISCYLTGSPGYLGRDTRGFNEWHMIIHVSRVEGSDM